MLARARALCAKLSRKSLAAPGWRQLIDALFDRESGCVRGLYSESQGQTVKSYRYQIVGLLLHNPLLQELQKQ